MKRFASLFVGIALLCASSAEGVRTGNAMLTAIGGYSPMSTNKSAPTQKNQNFGRLPLSFEGNRGQTDSRVRFLTHTAGTTLFLTPSSAIFALPSYYRTRLYSPNLNVLRPESKSSRVVVRMQMVGSDPKAREHGEQPLSGKVNYFLGNDPSRWHLGVPTFGRVGFQQVYKGVDVTYYGNQTHLEYDFVVAPHADPKQIALHFVGVTEVRVNASGDLIVRAQSRELHWKKPMVYQQNTAGRHSVPARFRLKRLPHGQTGVNFALGRYDSSLPLVIDPILAYSTYLGGTGSNGGDGASGIAIDSTGSAYLTGFAGSLDFPTSAGAYQKANHSAGITNAFVTKLNPTGTALVYSTYLGGSLSDNANAIAVDSAGNAYITGRAFSADFPTTPGAFQRVNKANHNAFVTKLNPTGNALVYSTYLGGTGSDSTDGIALDSNGHAFVTGHTVDSDFPTTPSAFQTVNGSSAGGNAFVTELNGDGSGLVYSTYLGGTGAKGDLGEGITVDSNNNAYVTGIAYSTDFPTTTGAFQRTENALNNSNAFVTKLNATGTALVYSTYLGGSGSSNGGDTATGIAIDGADNAYITGIASSSDFPTTSGAYQRVNKAFLIAPNGFVTKLNSAGTGLVYSTYLGGSSGTYAYHVAVDGVSNAYVTGYTNATDFPTTAGAFQRTSVGVPIGKPNSFVTKLNPAGSALIYSTYLGGTGGDYAGAITVDGNGYAYVAGATGSADFPTTSGVVQATNHALGAHTLNAFATKLFASPLFPDFNGDGNTDLLLQNVNSGVIAAWFMQGSQWTGGIYFSQSPPLEYSLVGTGDFHGDGVLALVLQSSRSNQIALWYTGGVNHGTITGGDYVNVMPQSGWKVVGVGDFNGDGKSDLVFQNQSTNQVAIWLMNGPDFLGGVLLPVIPITGWKIVGVGDLNADGFPDLIFQEQNTGQIAIWYMNGTTYIGGTVMSTVPAPGWKVVGVGDYNRDGYADLLFQNQTNYQASVWYLQNGAFAGGSALSLAPPTGWKIAGPR